MPLTNPKQLNLSVAWDFSNTGTDGVLLPASNATTTNAALRRQDEWSMPTKIPVKYATFDLDPWTYEGIAPDNTLTAPSNGVIQHDGVNSALGDRILVWRNAAPLENGIYEVTTVGDGGTAEILSRTYDCKTSGSLRSGSTVYVSEGSSYATKTFVCTSIDISIDPGITDNVWELLEGAAYVQIAQQQQTPNNTTGDTQDTNVIITGQPLIGSLTWITVNGVVNFNYGNETPTGDYYFRDSGDTTTRNAYNVQNGDKLWWNGVIAGYDLATTDRIDVIHSMKT